MAAAPDIPPFMDKLDVKYTQLFINNEWVPAKDNSTFPTENPATGEVICQVAEAKEADIDAAVAAAVKTNKRGSEWRKYGSAKRAALLHKLADLMMRDRQYIASLNCLDAGKVYAGEIMGTIYMAVDILRYMAGWADKDHGKVNPSDDGFFTYTRHEPIGVCGAIIPWNAPLGLACWKLAPCIATGNVLVLKPAELAPLSCLYMAALCKEAGFPPGVVNVVPGYGKTAGSALAHHMDVHKVSFTGSTLTGRAILKAAAESNLKRVSLELGGKSPNIIFPDVDLDMAVEWANTAVFFNNGQICCAGSRCFVHEDIYEEFVRRSVARAKSGVVGDPRQFNTQHGPQISKLQKDKILGMLKTARAEGCTVLCGGEGVKDKKGHFIQPTVLTDLTDDMTVSKEEIFGPVQQIFKFKTMEEVIERANKTSYGLAGAVFTKDINRALTVSNALEAGMIWVNCYFNMFCNTPFGGYKQSGHGREMSEYALREYTEVKSVIVKIDQTLQ